MSSSLSLSAQLAAHRRQMAAMLFSDDPEGLAEELAWVGDAGVPHPAPDGALGGEGDAIPVGSLAGSSVSSSRSASRSPSLISEPEPTSSVSSLPPWSAPAFAPPPCSNTVNPASIFLQHPLLAAPLSPGYRPQIALFPPPYPGCEPHTPQESILTAEGELVLPTIERSPSHSPTPPTPSTAAAAFLAAYHAANPAPAFTPAATTPRPTPLRRRRGRRAPTPSSHSDDDDDDDSNISSVSAGPDGLPNIPDAVYALAAVVNGLRVNRGDTYPSRNRLRTTEQLAGEINKKTGVLRIRKRGGQLRRFKYDQRLIRNRGLWDWLMDVRAVQPVAGGGRKQQGGKQM